MALADPRATLAAMAAAAAIVVLNVAALTLRAEHPWLPALDFVVDLSVLGLGIFAFVRQGLRAEARAAQARAALDATEARLAAILDSAMDGIVTVDQAQHVVLFNRAAEEMFRCDRAQVLGRSIELLIPARFRAAHHGHVERFGRTGETSRRMGDQTVLWATRPGDGSEFPIEASISQVEEAGRRYYTVILRDITRRRDYELAAAAREAELRELSARVLEAREEEKTLIGRELHDELGQLLTALKMDVAWVRERLPAGDAALASKVAGLSELLDHTVRSMRRISAELRPLMLDDLGLADAAAWLVEDFAARTGIECRLELPRDGSLDALERPVATALYRVLQESLTNIGRHAQARHVWASIATAPDGLRLEVEDDGVGIAEDRLAGTRSLGVKGMRERMRYLGGSLELSRAPRGGTRVAARLPLEARG